MYSTAFQVRRRPEGCRCTDHPGRHPGVHRVEGRRRTDVEKERTGDQT